MRKVIGYVDGKAIWTENVPADPGYRVIRGSFVVGGPGPNDHSNHAKEQRKSKAKLREAAA